MDVLTPEQRRYNMSRIRGRDTAPEILVRRALHARGYRFRLQDRKLPGRPDLVFPKHRAVVFVHGCFWHGHDCALFRWPATRREFWEDKIMRTRARDEAALVRLRNEEWRVLLIWECALKGPRRLTVSAVVESFAGFLRTPNTFSAEILGLSH